MRKSALTVAALAVCAVSLVAQEVSVTPASTMAEVSLLNVRSYSSYFLNGNGSISRKYYKEASNDDLYRITALSGDPADIDTPLEIALLSSCAGVVDIRPVAASNMLGNAKQADLKFGAAVYQEIQILRFLGNTAAVGLHEGELKFITDRGNVSRAEIEAYYRNGIRSLIAETVTEKLNERRDGYIPAEVYAQWKRIGAGDAQALMTDAITSFYLEPSQTTFRKLVEIYARQYELTLNDDLFASTGCDAFDAILDALNPAFGQKVGLAGLGLNVEAATLDPRYKVFSTPYGVGGGGQ